MRNRIREALTQTVWIQHGTRKKPKKLVVEPSERLVLGLYFAFLALILLTFLEATYIIILHSFNNEIFAVITLIVGTILGAFFGKKA
jgi:hypothetical protein